MKDSKAIPNGKNPFSASSDYHKTKIFVSGLDRTYRKSVFYKENFLEFDLAENFTIDVVRAVQSILEF
jgi:hypothetical protein